MWEEKWASNQNKEDEIQWKNHGAKKEYNSQSIQELQKHINILEWMKRGEIKRKEKYKVIQHKYRVKKKGLNIV